MKPDQRFLRQPKNFWANVRSLSQELGYTQRGTGQIKIFSIKDIVGGLKELHLSADHVVNAKGEPTEFGKILHAYFEHRAKVLNEYVRPRLMDKERAAKEFQTLYKKLKPKCPIPLNKQKGEKTGQAYLTGIVNMMIEQGIETLCLRLRSACADHDHKRRSSNSDLIPPR